jgi:hypothetical protein
MNTNANANVKLDEKQYTKVNRWETPTTVTYLSFVY